ncbi:hypothetical protein [Microcoleus sp. B13-B6]|uniref:hypothetical protein n=1 Tax=unclassified Microcoleus TaxID=2642155 RepID=UPI002FD0C454
MVLSSNVLALFDINSGCAGMMISNPRFIVGRKVESNCQQIIRVIFILLTHRQQSTVNSQQSTVNNMIPLQSQ